jgi:phage terminase large subunit-like protein
MSVVSRLLGLPRDQRAQVIRGLDPRSLLDLYHAIKYDWSLWVREKQKPPKGRWSYLIYAGGRGSGKTRPAAEQVVEWAKVPGTRIALVGRDAGTCRKVMVDGESGILACSPPWFKPRYYPSLKRLVWPNDSIGELHTAVEHQTLKGPQYHKAWCEELFHWRIPPKHKAPPAWDEGIRYCLRLGDEPQLIVTSSPRATDFCYDLLLGPKDERGNRPVKPRPAGHPDRYAADGFPWRWEHVTRVEIEGRELELRTVVARWPVEDNRLNLSPGKPEEWRKEYGASRLGQQELDGAILTKALGALFSTTTFDDFAVEGVPAIARTLVAVDPTRSESPTDECGIIVGGLGATDGEGYVWDDRSIRASPDGYVKRILEAVHKYGASAVVFEVNRMPETLMRTIKTKDRSVKFLEVTAIENKQTRAEPVSALYEQGKVHHVREPDDPDRLALLEDEMISWDPKARMPSPNRMDALVWLITALMLDEKTTRAPLVAR